MSERPIGKIENVSSRQCVELAGRLNRINQTTILNPIRLHGKGVHSATASTITLLPAAADVGVVFQVEKNGSLIEVPASYRSVTDNFLCTTLSSVGGTSIATVEHLLAAIYGLGIDNILIKIDGVEIPAMDGSAFAFVEAIDFVGIRELGRPRRFIKVLKPIFVQEKHRRCELRPYAGLSLDVEIDFQAPIIGHQRQSFEVCPKVFRTELARARTFGFLEDVHALWPAGRALGSSLGNTVVIRSGEVLNQGGLRYPDEFVRHKMLDVIGDLALVGAPLLCAYRSYCGGHKLNGAVVNELFADDDAWTCIEFRKERDTHSPIRQ
ncbi:MAG: UDP-3-O-acyl-N-acetylglucosamine deacetylase [Hyphomicrobiaceae bacterium]